MIVRSKTNKSHYSNIPLYKPNKDEVEQIKKVLIGAKCFLSYKKLKTKYACYCSLCDKYNIYTLDEFKQIRASKYCPKCLRKVTTTTKQYLSLRDFIIIRKDKHIYGYKVAMKWQFNKKIKAYIDQCLYTTGNEISYRKGCVRNMYSLGDSYDNEHWHKCDTSKYLGFFYDIDQKRNWYYNPEISKKQLYESYILPDMKSNQEKLIKENLFNENQIYYILNFDLKTPKEVIKYNRYITENSYTYLLDKPLNIYYLDYLSRNKINFKDYRDYMQDCITLDMKIGKPKNFNEEHKKLADMITELMNKDKKGMIKRRYNKLSSHSYINKDVEIKPFKTVREIINAGNKLNNCIGTYINDYAKGKTDLYYLAKSNKLLACIEIKKGILEQARIINNKQCNDPAIKKWCKLNNFALERN